MWRLLKRERRRHNPPRTESWDCSLTMLGVMRVVPLYRGDTKAPPSCMAMCITDDSLVKNRARDVYGTSIPMIRYPCLDDEIFLTLTVTPANRCYTSSSVLL